MKFKVLGLFVVCLILGGIGPVEGVQGECDHGVDPERLCRAIYLAEGGDKASRPYGILKGLIAEEPGHASYYCKEIIHKRLGMWDGKGDFISYIQKSWAPIGASNDPLNLNVNWQRSTKYWYDKL